MCQNSITRIALSEIFRDTYQIPIYQRDYAWGIKEIIQLLEDINTSDNKSYYIGTLVVSERKIMIKQYSK